VDRRARRLRVTAGLAVAGLCHAAGAAESDKPQRWQLDNASMAVAVRFAGGRLAIENVVDRGIGREMLDPARARALFTYRIGEQVVRADDGGWALAGQRTAPLEAFGRRWGTRLELALSRVAPRAMTVRAVFEMHEGACGMRFHTRLKNDEDAEWTVGEAEVLSLPFARRPATIHQVPGRTRWASSREPLSGGKRNAVVVYDDGGGWYVNPENNWCTSLQPGARKGSVEHPFLRLGVWDGDEAMTVKTDPAAVQLTLFPREEIEYFAVNFGVFSGDVWDGRVAASRHLRSRFHYRDRDLLLSTNDWQWRRRRTEKFYREAAAPAAAAAGFDAMHVDMYWAADLDTIVPNKGFTDDLKRVSDFIASQGLRQGYWLTLHGAEWGLGRDVADPKEVDFKLGQMRTLIRENHCAWTQIDLGLTWLTPKPTAYSHPKDSVYRKTLALRRYMNTLARENPDFLVHTTCEVDNPGGPQCVALMHVPDNGIAGMFRRTDDSHYLKDLFNCVGLFPLEACLEDWGGDGQRDAWQETPEWYYQFFLVRHVSVYADPSTWPKEGIARMRRFNDWRRLPRIAALTRQMALPVYSGPNGDNSGPWAWMHADDGRRAALLFAVDNRGGKQGRPPAAPFKAPLRWIDRKATYAIVDLTLETAADGTRFRIDWVTQAGGEELATQGVTIDFGALPYRAKCLALVAVDGQAPMIIAADDAVREWAAQADGGRRVAVQGAAGRKGRLLVYHPATKAAETIEATFGPDGRAVVDLGR
jgi:hypothetical protein